jgi:uncharacterized membrane protein
MLSFNVFVVLTFVVAIATAAPKNKLVLGMLDKSVAAAHQNNGTAIVQGIRCGRCHIASINPVSSLKICVFQRR